MSSTTISIAPASLLIDADNPRLPNPNESQRDVLRSLASHDQKKFLALAKDIVASGGLNPADMPIVLALNDDLKRYTVLEGNRRIAAIKVLENPETLVGAVDNVVLAELRRHGRLYLDNPIEYVTCLVVASRDEASHWIELRHTGQNEGAGIVPWGSDDAARFKARTGEQELHTQALNFLESQGLITPTDRRKIPATSYKRLLGTPSVREKIGIDFREGAMKVTGDKRRVAKALKYIADDLVSGNTKTRDIYTSDQRVEYANSLPSDIVLGRNKLSGAAGNNAVAVASTATRTKVAKPRDYMIPRDCVLNITDPRLKEIETELRKLRLEEFSNAVSVLFRVFIELSADAYIIDRTISVSIDAALGTKLLAVVSDLVSRQKLSRQQAVPVRRACQRDSFFMPSLTMMNQYVHNQNVFPAPVDLRAEWSSLQPFLMAVWSP